HIVADFWSIAVLMAELGVLYEATKNQSEVALLPLELSYTDYALWQSAMLLGPSGERLWSYWSKQLAGELPILDLPTDRSRPPVQTYQGATHHFSLSNEVTNKLHDLAHSHNATLYMTLLAAFQVMLMRYTGQRDILVGSPTAGRSRAALSGLVGYFANTLVLRAQIGESESFATLLDQVRQTVLDALEHQDYPLALLVERLQVARDPARSPLFQVMFSLQKTPPACDQDLGCFALGERGGEVEIGGLRFESLPLERQIAQFDLALNVVETDDSIHGALRYNTDLFEASTIARFVDHLQVLLHSITIDPA